MMQVEHCTRTLCAVVVVLLVFPGIVTSVVATQSQEASRYHENSELTDFGGETSCGTELNVDDDGRLLCFPGEDGTLRLIIYGQVRELSDLQELNLQEQVKFFYHSKNAPNGQQIFVGNLTGLKFEAGPIKFITHGFWSGSSAHWVKDMALRFIEEFTNTNIIIVDWNELASTPLYTTARTNTKAVGGYIAEMMTSIKDLGVNNKLHCIGHSLGAHVCGYAGKKLKDSGKRLDRITGLDPAGPLFSMQDSEERLSMGDALFVDVIHTCGRSLGFPHSIGHMDFFPNGGSQQVACVADIFDMCSHARAHDFFTDSFHNHSRFCATLCGSYDSFMRGECKHRNKELMGEHAKPNSTYYGDYYLQLEGGGTGSLFSITVYISVVIAVGVLMFMLGLCCNNLSKRCSKYFCHNLDEQIKREYRRNLINQTTDED